MAAIRKEVVGLWKELLQFRGTAIRRSLDGTRVFTYSQWLPRLDHRPAVLGEYYSPESRSLEITAFRHRETATEGPLVVVGDRLTHLAEFRMKPSMQPEMMRRTTAAL